MDHTQKYRGIKMKVLKTRKHSVKKKKKGVNSLNHALGRTGEDNNSYHESFQNIIIMTMLSQFLSSR